MINLILHIQISRREYSWRGPLIAYGNLNLHAANGGDTIGDTMTEYLRDIVDYSTDFNDTSIRIRNHDIALSGRDTKGFASLLNCANTEAAGV